MRRALMLALALLPVSAPGAEPLPVQRAEPLSVQRAEPLPVQGTERVASAGLCADQMVIPLVGRGRIAGVSAEAAAEAVSPVAEQARGLPTLSPSAEDLVLSGADVVVLNSYGDGKTEALLKKLGVRVVRVPDDTSLGAIPASLRGLGAALGAKARGTEMAEDFNRRLEAVRTARRESAVVAAYLRPDGGSAGRGTYVAEAMTAAGYESLAARRGQTGWGRVELETLVLDPPEALVTSFFERKGDTLRRLFGNHPVFRRLAAERPLVPVPGRLWGCGGWPVIAATEYMAAHHPMRGTP